MTQWVGSPQGNTRKWSGDQGLGARSTAGVAKWTGLWSHWNSEEGHSRMQKPHFSVVQTEDVTKEIPVLKEGYSLRMGQKTGPQGLANSK